LINAISYSEAGKKITIRSNKLDKKILVEITDQGIGMRKEDVQRIFERFYRVDKSRARNKGGTGLGLAIVKHIIEAHGESITVRSIPEQGSTFTFSLEAA
jgi:two-component system phosphate regulon sensor histidine kinase PhoR